MSMGNRIGDIEGIELPGVARMNGVFCATQHQEHNGTANKLSLNVEQGVGGKDVS